MHTSLAINAIAVWSKKSASSAKTRRFSQDTSQAVGAEVDATHIALVILAFRSNRMIKKFRFEIFDNIGCTWIGSLLGTTPEEEEAASKWILSRNGHIELCSLWTKDWLMSSAHGFELEYTDCDPPKDSVMIELVEEYMTVFDTRVTGEGCKTYSLYPSFAMWLRQAFGLPGTFSEPYDDSDMTLWCSVRPLER